MLELYQEYLAILLNATQVTWYAGYKGVYGRDLWHTKIMHDWKIFDIKFPLGTSYDRDQAAKSYYKIAKAQGSPDPQVMTAVNNAGKSRVHLLYEATTPKEWDSHWMKQMLANFDIGERMVGAYTLSYLAESYFLIDRPIGAEPFTQEDKKTFLNALVSFPRLHYWLFLIRGLVQPALRPLSPREQEVLIYLLGSKSETEIADEMNLSKGTVHNYVLEIYKNFGVTSRYELAQIWLGSFPNRL